MCKFQLVACHASTFVCQVHVIPCAAIVLADGWVVGILIDAVQATQTVPATPSAGGPFARTHADSACVTHILAWQGLACWPCTSVEAARDGASCHA